MGGINSHPAFNKCNFLLLMEISCLQCKVLRWLWKILCGVGEATAVAFGCLLPWISDSQPLGAVTGKGGCFQTVPKRIWEPKPEWRGFAYGENETTVKWRSNHSHDEFVKHCQRIKAHFFQCELTHNCMAPFSSEKALVPRGCERGLETLSLVSTGENLREIWLWLRAHVNCQGVKGRVESEPHLKLELLSSLLLRKIAENVLRKMFCDTAS